MKLGDFFVSAALARPVNPKPVTFTAFVKAPTLPGGERNPHDVIAAKITGALVFMGGDGSEQARAEARKFMSKTYRDEKTGEVYFTEDDLWTEIGSQIIWRVVKEWDPGTRKVGSRLFETMEQVREMLEPTEANKIVAAYNKYVADEHPSDVDGLGKKGDGVDPVTFRGA